MGKFTDGTEKTQGQDHVDRATSTFHKYPLRGEIIPINGGQYTDWRSAVKGDSVDLYTHMNDAL